MNFIPEKDDPNKKFQIKTLNVMWNFIGSEGCNHLTKFLNKCDMLESLNIYGNFIGEEGLNHITNYFKNVNELKLIYFNIGSIFLLIYRK